MFTTVLLPLLLAGANVLGASMLVPQVIRIGRTGRIDGVSGPWIGVGIALNSWWAIYALHGRLWGILPVSVGATALYLATAVLFSQIARRRGVLEVLAGTIGVASVPALALLAGGWSVAGLVIGLGYGVQFSPAAISAYRSRDVSGISLVTWSMALTEASIWLIYGLASGDRALYVGGIGASVTSLLIVIRLLMARTWNQMPDALADI